MYSKYNKREKQETSTLDLKEGFPEKETPESWRTSRIESSGKQQRAAGKTEVQIWKQETFGGTARQYDQNLELKREKLQNSLPLLLTVTTISDRLHTPELEC